MSSTCRKHLPPNQKSLVMKMQMKQSDTETAVAGLSFGRSIKAKSERKWIEIQQQFQPLSTIVYVYQSNKDDDHMIDYLRVLAYTILL